MTTKQIFASCAKTVFGLAAVVMMSNVFTACSKDDNDGDDNGNLITATTTEGVGKTIEVMVAENDKPQTEGLEEVNRHIEDGWLKIDYQVKEQTFKIKGAITKLAVDYCNLKALHVARAATLREIYCHNNMLNYSTLSLPAVSNGLLYFKGASEDSQTLTPQKVKELRNKGWKVLMEDDEGYAWVAYEGEDPSAEE